MPLHRSSLWFLLAVALVAAATGATIATSPALVVGGGSAVVFFAWVATRPPSTTAAVAALVAVAVVVAIPVNRLQDGYGSLRSLVPLLLAALAAVAAIRCRPLAANLVAVVMGVLGFAVLATVQHSDQGAWRNLVLFAVTALAGVLLGGSVAAARAGRPVGIGLVVLAAAEAGYAAYEALGGAEPLWVGAAIRPDGTSAPLPNLLIDGLTRAQGTFGHPLPLACFLLVALVIALRLRPFPRLARLALVLLLVAGLVATGSRNALILAGLIVFLKAGRGAASGRMAALVAGSAVALMVALPSLSSTYGSFAETGSFTHRIGTLDSMGRLLTERDAIASLFGDGSASAFRLFRQGFFAADGLFAVDNQIVLLLAEYGLVGVVAVVWLLAAAVSRSRGTARVVLLVLLAQFFIFDALAWPGVAVLLWGAVGGAWVASQPTVSSDGPTAVVARHP